MWAGDRLLRARRHLLTIGLFVLLAIVHTWPLASAPGHLSRNDNADTILNEWILAWDAHQLAQDPRHLFDANIFYPNHNALAYSEHLLVPAVFGAPLFWAGASPVLVYNLLLLLGLALTAWATSVVVTQWTGDQWAGLLSGTLFAFSASTLTRLPHLQSQHREFMLLSLLAFDALLVAPRLRHALTLAGWFALQALTSYYTFVFTSLMLSVGLLVRRDAWGGQARRVLLYFVLAMGLAFAVITPFLLPYIRLGVRRPLDEVARYAATWRDYLSTPGRLHYALWSAREFGRTALFPGLTGLVLAVVALCRISNYRDPRVRMVLAFGVVGFALSFGPALPGYRLLYTLIPPVQGIRAAARFGNIALLCVAMLAGFGLAALRHRWPAARWLAPSVLVLANLEAFAGPIPYVVAPPPNALYARLAHAGAVAEFPFYPPDHIFHNAPYLLNTTQYWRPLLNGYSGLVPASYVADYEALKGFPDAAAIEALRKIGITHVVVHYGDQAAWFGDASVARLRHTAALRLVAADGSVGIYTLDRRAVASVTAPPAVDPLMSAP